MIHFEPQSEGTMRLLQSSLFCFFLLISYCFYSSSAAKIPVNELLKASSSSPFSVVLQTLQKQIGYDFKNIGLLRRAMTHPSYSGENNRALSTLGLDLIQTAVSLRSLQRNIDISAKDLNRHITKITQLDSCAQDALRLGLEKVIRVQAKTNSSSPPVVCSAFRSIFGAIAVDTSKADAAATVLWSVLDHGTKAM